MCAALFVALIVLNAFDLSSVLVVVFGALQASLKVLKILGALGLVCTLLLNDRTLFLSY